MFSYAAVTHESYFEETIACLCDRNKELDRKNHGLDSALCVTFLRVTIPSTYSGVLAGIGEYFLMERELKLAINKSGLLTLGSWLQ